MLVAGATTSVWQKFTPRISASWPADAVQCAGEVYGATTRYLAGGNVNNSGSRAFGATLQALNAHGKDLPNKRLEAREDNVWCNRCQRVVRWIWRGALRVCARCEHEVQFVEQE